MFSWSYYQKISGKKWVNMVFSTNESQYSRMDHIKFVEEIEQEHYLVRSWTLYPK